LREALTERLPITLHRDMRRAGIALTLVVVSMLTACGSHHTEWPAALVTYNDDGCFTARNPERTEMRTICSDECFRGKYAYNYKGRTKIDPWDEACLGAQKAIQATY